MEKEESQQECVDAAQTGPAGGGCLHTTQSAAASQTAQNPPGPSLTELLGHAQEQSKTKMELNRTEELLEQMKRIIFPCPTK